MRGEFWGDEQKWRPQAETELPSQAIKDAARVIEEWMKGRGVQKTIDVREATGITEHLCGRALRYLEQTGKIARPKRCMVHHVSFRPSQVDLEP